MSEKFEKPCPFCGEKGTEKYERYISVIHKKDCLFYENEDYGLTTYDTPQWQSRPIEDALQIKIRELIVVRDSITDILIKTNVKLNELQKENEELRKHQIPDGWICHP